MLINLINQENRNGRDEEREEDMIFSRSVKRRLTDLENRIGQIEKESKQSTCPHNLEDRIFRADFFATALYVEECFACKKIIQRFSNKIDWNKGRIRYMKARIKELEKSIVEK